MTNIQLGAVGVPLIFPLYDEDNLPLNVAAADSITLTFRAPSGAKVSKAATKITGGDNNQVQYITEAGFLNEARTWRVQARIVTSAAGTDLFSLIAEFVVADNL